MITTSIAKMNWIYESAKDLLNSPLLAPVVGSLPLLCCGLATWCFYNTPFDIVYLLFPLIGIRVEYITNNVRYKEIISKMTLFTQKANEHDGFGHSIGYWYYAKISDPTVKSTIWIIATNATMERLLKVETIKVYMKDTQEIKRQESTQLTIYYYSGYLGIVPGPRKIPFKITTPTIHQSPIIQQIYDHYRQTAHSVVFISGAPGTGKSMIGPLLALRYKDAPYCNSFQPWTPSVFITDIAVGQGLSIDRPLIIMLDEIDIAIAKIHKGEIQHSKQYRIQTPDKSGWNRLFDDIGRGLYPYVIVIMTTNRSLDDINSLDPSYLRPGRVDLYFKMDEPLHLHKVLMNV